MALIIWKWRDIKTKYSMIMCLTRQPGQGFRLDTLSGHTRRIRVDNLDLSRVMDLYLTGRCRTVTRRQRRRLQIRQVDFCYGASSVQILINLRHPTISREAAVSFELQPDVQVSAVLHNLCEVCLVVPCYHCRASF